VGRHSRGSVDGKTLIRGEETDGAGPQLTAGL
jgi:hypothetical protein